ncbi:MAG: hypothetical protein DRR16_22610 [Candidatus Parabeggiatoa sp. nov. 3]|nr:MAG: hypothetical protein DRR00_25170 [Gammaproteobacteria bacterium]RKZ67237.1 MAG: hypothetical protein DRQ99_07255 [Gammaproteobacteria bacterium]RKZ81149.1 MAG: hypothetical protein DRR16_22610 [Gammaproteobacteria bacterium]
MKKIIFLGLFLVTSVSVAQAAQWIDGSGKSCSQVCLDKGMSPVISGIWEKNGNNFNVCAADAEGKGFRAGYNLIPGWATTCTVGWGGQEKSYSKYNCLCQ